MANKMIIDASHPEETRVVVLRGNRVEEFDFEAANKKPLRGNIYLAKVTRVEPSLQAAFVDYGGNRHGFLAFSEIHPDYYQIPIADRQALIEEETRSHFEDEDEPNGERRSRRHRRARPQETAMRAGEGEAMSEAAALDDEREEFRHGPIDDETGAVEGAAELEFEAPAAMERLEELEEDEREAPWAASAAVENEPPAAEAPVAGARAAGPVAEQTEAANAFEAPASEAPAPELLEAPASASAEGRREPESEGEPVVEPARKAEIEARERGSEDDEEAEPDFGNVESIEPPGADDDEPDVITLGGGSEETEMRAPRSRRAEEPEPIEIIGGDAMDETPRRAPRLRRHYKIQEVIKRRQVLLVQVVKEERGNKGAALTTYLSLAGRYCVLMPNTARGGGISRKITNAQDRSRLKSIAEELDVPEGMGVILRTAGAMRTKQEVKRDFEYLLRTWETVRETTLSSTAPMLVYEEGSLIKRAIRDLYGKDVDEVVVAGETGYREARGFMRLLMPNHVKAITPYRDTQPVFAKAGVEAQLDAMFSNQVTLKSGGYIVINQTEALVAIDVNSGRSTREHNIEDTALRTNLEAADEIARQLRLRDLAGLIVVDFIDMEEARNNRAVERRMKEALKNDRARIQVGRISHFGLLEMSRQRIRTGVLEGSTVPCPHCLGAGVVRSTSSIALHVLRVLEDALIKSAAHDLTVRARTQVALYILNQKRAHLRDLERRFGVTILVEADDLLTGANYHAIERGEPASGLRAIEADAENRAAGSGAPAEDEDAPVEASAESEDEVEVEVAEAEPAEEEFEPSEGEGEIESDGETEGARETEAGGDESDRGRRRRRRRRRRGSERAVGEFAAPEAAQPNDEGLAAVAEIGGDFAMPAAPSDGEESARASGPRRRRSRRGRRGGTDRYAAPSPEGASEEGGVVEDFEGEPPALSQAAPTGLDEQPELPGFEPPIRESAQIVEAAVSEPAPEAPLTGTEEAAVEVPTAGAEEPTAEIRVAGAEEPAPQPPLAAPREEFAPETPAIAEAEPAVAETSTEPDAPAPAPEEPPRPRRSGWWQRARATIVGD